MLTKVATVEGLSASNRAHTSYRCLGEFRNTGKPTRVLVKYLHRILHVYLDTGDGVGWKFCLAVGLDKSYKDYHIAFSAATGQVADSHDILEVTTRYLAASDKDFDDSLLPQTGDRSSAASVSLFWFVVVIGTDTAAERKRGRERGLCAAQSIRWDTQRVKLIVCLCVCAAVVLFVRVCCLCLYARVACALHAAGGSILTVASIHEIYQFTLLKTIDAVYICERLNALVLPHYATHWAVTVLLLLARRWLLLLLNVPLAAYRVYAVAKKQHLLNASLVAQQSTRHTHTHHTHPTCSTRRWH
jgi:hypothetical protein